MKPRPGRAHTPRVGAWPLLIPIAVMSAAGVFADWFAAPLIVDHPLLQIFLNPRLRYLALAANRVDAAEFYAVGFFRLVLTDPLFYLLGLWYGEAAFQWVERRTGSGAWIRTVERWFSKAGAPIVALAPSGLVCLLAGASGMSPALFVTLNVAGTVARLILVRTLAAAFAGPLESVVDLVSRYQWWLVGVSVALGLAQWWQRRHGRSPGGLVAPGTPEAEGEAPAAPALETAATEDPRSRMDDRSPRRPRP